MEDLDKREVATASDNCGPAGSVGVPSSATSPQAEPAAATPPAERGTNGQFLPGRSGNPKGKPKGLRNHITLKRLELEAALRDYLNTEGNRRKAQRAIDRMFTIADTGDDKQAVAAIKVLLGSVLAAPKQEEDAGTGDRAVTVIIENRISDHAGQAVRAEITDVDYEEVSNG